MSIRRTTTGPSRRRESEARRGAHIACPDCGSDMTIRSSHVQSATLRQLEYRCTEHECGGSFAALLEITYRLSLPAQPNPAVDLPLSTRIDRAAIAAVLDTADAITPATSTLPAVNGDLFATGPPGT